MKKFFKLFLAALLLISANSILAQTQVCSNPKCHGGKIYCDDCDYTGTITCKKCVGRGKIDGNTCSNCNGKRMLSCGKCNGKGYFPCSNCGGKGSNSSGNTGNNGGVGIGGGGGNDGDDGKNVCNGMPSRHQYTCPECKGDKLVVATIPNVAMEPFTVKSVIIPGQLTIVVKNVKEVEMFLSIGKKTVLNVMGKNTFHRKNERNVHAEMARGRFPEMVRLFMLIVPVAKAKDIFRKIQLFHAHIADRKVI